jgi:nicotinamidase-related amidase
MSTALLVMDLQVGIVERYHESARCLAAAARALATARSIDLPILFVRIAFRSGYPEVSPRNRAFATVRAGETFTDASPATQIHPTVAPRPGEPVVLKKRVSAFAGSDLEIVLRARGVTRVVLCGIATSGVVLSTLREAADRDYEIVVLADACFDADEEVHRVLVQKVFPRQAEVMSVDEWEATLRKP